jgi:hypothetical protein
VAVVVVVVRCCRSVAFGVAVVFGSRTGVVVLRRRAAIRAAALSMAIALAFAAPTVVATTNNKKEIRQLKMFRCCIDTSMVF